MHIDIPLKEKVKVNGQQYTSLTMRGPKVRDLKVARRSDGSAFDQDVLLAANLCDVPVEVIDELEVVDWDAVQAAYDNLAPERPEMPLLKQGMAILAREYGQQFSEIENMEVDDFVDWLVQIRDEKIKRKEG